MNTTLRTLLRTAVCATPAAVAAILFLIAPAANALDLSCGQAATTIEGAVGAQIMVTCPPGCGDGAVWGTHIYSDDSAVCTAARHAGVLAPGTGGSVTIQISGGETSYAASTANGVTTFEWGEWGRSFFFVGATVALTCRDNAQNLAGDEGARIAVTCPAGCVDGGTVWGTGTYSDDSAVCRAAIHAGVMTNEGGPLTVVIAAGLPAYPASSMNGVDTSDWGEWSRSFTVE